MKKKKTILFHSGTGLAALIAGLCMSKTCQANLKVNLPRLWPKIKEPGQYLVLEHAEYRIICFNCGSQCNVVNKVLADSLALWDGSHITCRHVLENRLVSLRVRLFCLYPSLYWLVTSEIRNGKAAEWWR